MFITLDIKIRSFSGIFHRGAHSPHLFHLSSPLPSISSLVSSRLLSHPSYLVLHVPLSESMSTCMLVCGLCVEIRRRPAQHNMAPHDTGQHHSLHTCSLHLSSCLKSRQHTNTNTHWYGCTNRQTPSTLPPPLSIAPQMKNQHQPHDDNDNDDTRTHFGTQRRAHTEHQRKNNTADFRSLDSSKLSKSKRHCFTTCIRALSENQQGSGRADTEGSKSNVAMNAFARKRHALTPLDARAHAPPR